MRRVTTLLACLVFAIAARNASAQDRLHDFHVLAIGINDSQKYPDLQLHQAVPDVAALARMFAAQDHPGAQETLRRTRALYDGSATKQAIEEKLADLPNWVADGGTLAIVYSGHGCRFGGHWFLFPYDGDRDHVEESCVSGERLMSAIDAAIAKRHCRVLLILDACQSGELVNAAEPVLAKYRRPDQGGLILMAACTPGQESMESVCGGIFTSSILLGLNGQKAHTEPTSAISLREISRFLRSDIQLRLRTEMWKAPGLEWPEQNLVLEHSPSISDDMGITAANPGNTYPLSTSVGTDKPVRPANCTAIQSKSSPVGIWRCVRPLVIKPSRLLTNQPTLWLQMTGKSTGAANVEPILLVDNNGDPVIDQVILQLADDGHYEVLYLDPTGHQQTASGRYRFQPGVEFSLTYGNGTDYFSLVALDKDHLVLRVGSSLGYNAARTDPEFRFERVEEKSN